MLTQNELKSFLNYDPETGIFRWNISQRGHRKKGDVAGTKSGRYSYITICGNTFLAHRLAWLYCYGSWPVDLIDHIDRNSRNNAIANLRDVSGSKNMQNMVVDGASFDKRTGRWYSQIVASGERWYLGSYESSDDARAAYQAAKRVVHADNPLVKAPATQGDIALLGNTDGRLRTNTSGFHGVSFKAAKGRYEAHIRINGKYKFVGLFATAQEASDARDVAIVSMNKSTLTDLGKTDPGCTNCKHKEQK